MMGKLLCRAVTVFLAAAVITGCTAVDEKTSGTDETASKETLENRTEPETESQTVSETQIAPESDNARITYSVQEYIDDNIAEIPYIEYEGDTNPEIESINRSLNQGIRRIYDDFMSAGNEHAWIEIRSYPFTSNDYLQAVVSYCIYPTYGTDGDMFSINYDRKAQKALSVDDALTELGMDRAAVSAAVERLYETDEPLHVTETAVTGFLKDGETHDITLLLEITLEAEEADGGWKYFYAYTPALDVLFQLDKTQLFEQETQPSAEGG